jgi:hypothetical protein
MCIGSCPHLGDGEVGPLRQLRDHSPEGGGARLDGGFEGREERADGLEVQGLARGEGEGRGEDDVVEQLRGLDGAAVESGRQGGGREGMMRSDTEIL